MKKWFRVLWGVLFMAILIPLLPLSAEAAGKTIYNSPYVTFSTDGKAWTTNAGDKGDGTDMWDPDYDTPVKFDEVKLPILREGQHLYKTKRTGEIPISSWKVTWAKGQCIHNKYPDGDFHGLHYGRQKCLANYYSGWTAYCADCGEPINRAFVYMSREAAESIEYFQVEDDLDYYYLCPFCNNLEQGHAMVHYCKDISSNRYLVKYDANPVGESFQGVEERYIGYMSPSIHMYNNASAYEGQEVTPVTRLSLNTYSRIGYRFLGWNTKPDGSGDFYEDGARILNLTAENWDGTGNSSEGTVTLYAQWKRTEGTLQIDPDGGTYGGNSGITALNKLYGMVYTPDASLVAPPAGYQVSFESNGGSPCPAVTGTRHFTEWSMVQPFQGSFLNGIYTFGGPDGTADTLRVCYEADSIVLPKPVRAGYSFGGWYYDPEFTKPAGGSGDAITPDRNMTLYAQWVELVLRSTDNYSANGGKGAVDLSWSQPDGNGKTYLVYQSRDLQTWSRINTAEDIDNSRSVEKSFAFTGKTETYTVPYAGTYTLSLSGAQGGNYGAYRGGAGGNVSGRFYLYQGEVLTVRVGGQNGYGGGGSASAYGCGGGATMISSDKKGTLLIAGGGGGASLSGNGQKGGSNASPRADKAPEGASGMAGGGGGYVGGNAGSYVAHYHVDASGTLTGSKNGTDKSIKVRGGCYTKEITATETLTGTCSYHYNWRAGIIEICGACGRYAMQVHCLWKWHSYSGHNTGAHGEEEGGYWQCNNCGTRGFNWGSGAAGESGTHEYTHEASVTYYVLSCGYFDGQILSSSPAYGGSSYVNTTYALSHTRKEGMQNGNGRASVSGDILGFQDVPGMDGVTATDMAAPSAVEQETAELTPAGAGRVTVSWQKPADNGTVYYHKAETYLRGSVSGLCESNVTKNTLTSGIKGYLYTVDQKPDTAVGTAGHFIRERSVTIEMRDYVQYLHLAAVDVAGNIGSTIHIRLGADSVDWKLYTGQLQIGSGENVYAAGAEKTYYVRCDGVTPFLLEHVSYMEGPAAKGYQLNYTIYETEVRNRGGSRAQNIIFTPSAENPEADPETKAEDLTYSVSGTTLLGQYPYSVTTRSDRGRSLKGVQKFLLSRDAQGKLLDIRPRAGADFLKNGLWEIRYSDAAADAGNGITVIGDGERPVITGLDELRNREPIDRGTESIRVNVTAWDALSGVADFYVKIQNRDNYSEQTFYQENGKVALELTQEDPLFTGDFTVTGHAVDNVGNVTEISFDVTEFALETRIERILEPHTPLFKCGESGILYITTYGYADRVEVEFPEELTALNPELNRTFDYTDMQVYRQESQLQFMIPLYAPENQNYTVTVRAYKEGGMLEDKPAMSTIQVGGTVLGEIRTRLR